MNRPLRPVLALIALALSTSAYDTPFLTTADMQVHYSDTKGLIRSEGGATLFVHDRIDSVLVGGKKLVIAERGDNWVKVDLPAGEHAVEVTLGDRAGNYPIRLTPAPEKRPLVRTPSELAKALAAAAPGSEVIIANGVYNGWRVSFTSDGTAGQPVTIRPQTPGGVTFRLHCELRIKADHVVFKGFRFEHCERTVLRIEGGSHNRITQCQFLYCGSPGSTFGHILSIYPDSHHSRVDHCYWTGSKAMSLGIRAPGDKASCPTHNRLDHNVFRDVYRIWINGQENIQLGQGKHSHKQSLHTLVEYNLFHHAWGDGEIFSSKTSHNTFRHNVAAHCPRAAFTLRGGNHATVDGNIMVGNGNGVRIFGCDHAIINNLIAGSQSSAIHFYSHNQGAPPQRVLVAHNTLLNNTGGISAGIIDDAFRDNRVVNNIFASERGTFIPDNLAGHVQVERNMFHATGTASTGLEGREAITGDPMLAGKHGLPRLHPGSPAIDAALPLNAVSHDVFARPRTTGSPRDLGAEELGAGPGTAVQRLMPLIPGPRQDNIDLYKKAVHVRGDPADPGGLWEFSGNAAAKGEDILTTPGTEAVARSPLPTGDFIAQWEYRPEEFATTAGVRLADASGRAWYRIHWGGVAEDGRPAGLIALEKNGELIGRHPDTVLLRRNYLKSKGWPGEQWGLAVEHPNPELWYRFQLVRTGNRLVVTLNHPRLLEKGTPRDDWFLPVLVWEDKGLIAGPPVTPERFVIEQGTGAHGGRWRQFCIYEHGYIGDTPPPAPSGLKATVDRPNVVRLHWRLPPETPESVTIDVYRGATRDFEPTPRNRVAGRVHGILHEDIVDDNQTYVYKVCSVNLLGMRSPPKTVGVTTPPGKTSWIAVTAGEVDNISKPLALEEDAETGTPFVWGPPGSGRRMESPGADGVAEFVVDIPQAGVFHIWSDVYCIDSAHDSFFVSSPSFNGGKPVTHYTVPKSRWLWNLVPTGGPVALAAGQHTIRYHLREEQTRLRRLLITSDLDWRPYSGSVRDTPVP